MQNVHCFVRNATACFMLFDCANSSTSCKRNCTEERDVYENRKGSYLSRGEDWLYQLDAAVGSES